MSAPPLFHLMRGAVPLLVSFPHSGTYLPPEIAARMTPEALAVPDTEAGTLHVYSGGQGVWDDRNDIARILGVDNSRITVELVSNGGAKPYRLKVRPPSFINLQALPKMVVGGLIADMVAVIGTLDIVLGEIDR